MDELQLDDVRSIDQEKERSSFLTVICILSFVGNGLGIAQGFLGGEVAFQGKEGQAYHRYSGICLEQQAEPDAPNHSNFSDIYLSKGQSKINLLTIQFEQ